MGSDFWFHYVVDVGPVCYDCYDYADGYGEEG